jgi:hypothetical protein
MRDVNRRIALVDCHPSEFSCSNTADVDSFRNQFHFMKRAYSFAAVFIILMSWQALAANPPPDPADALYNRVMELYGQRKFA